MTGTDHLTCTSITDGLLIAQSTAAAPAAALSTAGLCPHRLSHFAGIQSMRRRTTHARIFTFRRSRAGAITGFYASHILRVSICLRCFTTLRSSSACRAIWRRSRRRHSIKTERRSELVTDDTSRHIASAPSIYNLRHPARPPTFAITSRFAASRNNLLHVAVRPRRPQITVATIIVCSDRETSAATSRGRGKASGSS